jgi:1-acyl-sn-glycerol-3-phosphate acyltransferase
MTKKTKKAAKRFDMYRKPNKPKWYLKIVEYVAAPFFMLFGNAHVKTDKEVRKLKGPYLILSTHASFMDFPMLVRGIMPRTTGWVMSVEEFRRGDWLMYGIGGIPKRKFTHDMVTAKHMLRYLRTQKHSVALYPEARFELAGINERLDGALGKLRKHAKVPVVMLKAYGNFINSPQWSKHPYRGIRQEAHIFQLFTPEQLEQLSADEIQAKIEQAFEKDEYAWQVEKGYHTKCKKRADGLYKILYKCPACGVEFKTKSAGTKLWCEHCGAEWEMDTLSRLKGVNTDKGFSHIPDWYRWEREEVRKEVLSGEYHFEDDVRVEDYCSTPVGFVAVGEAHVTHDENGFTFKGTVDGKPFELNKPVSSMYSVHVEYDFLNRGDAFDIAVDHTTYFMFLKTAENYLTKMHFATEELYDHYVAKKY